MYRVIYSRVFACNFVKFFNPFARMRVYVFACVFVRVIQRRKLYIREMQLRSLYQYREYNFFVFCCIRECSSLAFNMAAYCCVSGYGRSNVTNHFRNVVFSLICVFRIDFPLRTLRLNSFLRLFLNDTIRRRPFLEVINAFKIVLITKFLRYREISASSVF